MARPYSADLNECAFTRAGAGESRRSVAKAFGASPSAVIKCAEQGQRRGDAAPSRLGGGGPTIGGDQAAWFIDRTESGDDVTIRGAVAELAARGLDVSRFAVWRFVRAEGSH
ncbi:MAG: hypothetical protein AAGM38_10805 [Pseudomonadota bacterium]